MKVHVVNTGSEYTERAKVVMVNDKMSYSRLNNNIIIIIRKKDLLLSGPRLVRFD